ncbi:MAG: 6-O-methylguanine DNA methyltransferase [Hyphomicrobiales bacterium]|nr:MAG: 6-O-methylguanine DNA methyltransferase [Hyphomicrobiales bacterium]
MQPGQSDKLNIASLPSESRLILSVDTTDGAEGDYRIVRDAIEFITEHRRDQPGLEAIAGHVGLSPAHFQKVFTRWCGLSPKAFLQAITLDHARELLRQSASVLDTTYEVGLSGPARLHDLFITHEAMTPGAYKARGGGLTIRWGFEPSPFGTALVMTTDHGLCGLAFCDAGEERAAFEDMAWRWPAAEFVEDRAVTGPLAARIFDPGRWSAQTPLRVVMIGTDFEIRVWETLLRIPLGAATTYSDIAERVCSAKAARAVGTAVGRNPISFVVPCHRVLGKSGAVTGYHWGMTRKRAILGWEAALSGQGGE